MVGKKNSSRSGSNNKVLLVSIPLVASCLIGYGAYAYFLGNTPANSKKNILNTISDIYENEDDSMSTILKVGVSSDGLAVELPKTKIETRTSDNSTNTYLSYYDKDKKKYENVFSFYQPKKKGSSAYLDISNIPDTLEKISSLEADDFKSIPKEDAAMAIESLAAYKGIGKDLKDALKRDDGTKAKYLELDPEELEKNEVVETYTGGDVSALVPELKKEDELELINKFISAYDKQYFKDNAVVISKNNLHIGLLAIVDDKNAKSLLDSYDFSAKEFKKNPQKYVSKKLKENDVSDITLGFASSKNKEGKSDDLVFIVKTTSESGSVTNMDYTFTAIEKDTYNFNASKIKKEVLSDDELLSLATYFTEGSLSGLLGGSGEDTSSYLEAAFEESSEGVSDEDGSSSSDSFTVSDEEPNFYEKGTMSGYITNFKVNKLDEPTEIKLPYFETFDSLLALNLPSEEDAFDPLLRKVKLQTPIYLNGYNAIGSFSYYVSEDGFIEKYAEATLYLLDEYGHVKHYFNVNKDNFADDFTEDLKERPNQFVIENGPCSFTGLDKESSSISYTCDLYEEKLQYNEVGEPLIEKYVEVVLEEETSEDVEVEDFYHDSSSVE